MTLNAKNVLQVAVIFYRIFRKLTAKFAGWPTPPHDDTDSPFRGTSPADPVVFANSLAAHIVGARAICGAGGSSAEFKLCFTREIDTNLFERQIRMASGNVLAEKEFDISLNDQTHKIKATAEFLVHDVAPQERGIYILDFTLGGQHAKTTQPDETYYSREGARRAAELAFSSGEVEAFVKRQIQSWINLGR